MITPSFGLTATERVLPRLALDWTTGLDQPGVDVVRAGVATYVGSDGLIKVAAENTQRKDHSKIIPALLVEETRTNLNTYSAGSYVNGSNGYVNSGTLATTIDGIEGNTTAQQFTFSTGTVQNLYKVFSVTASTAYAFSFYYQLGTYPESEFRIAFRDDTNGAFISTDVVPTKTPLSGGWVRATHTVTTPVGCLLLRCYLLRFTPVTGGTIAFDGVQLELGAFDTSYIPTEATAVTRNADVPTMTGTNFSDWFNASEGTLVSQWLIPAGRNNITRRLFNISDGTDTNRLTINVTTSRASSLFSTNGSTSLTTTTAYTADQMFKTSVAVKDNDQGIALGGTAAITSATNDNPTQTLTTLIIGSLHAGTQQPCGFLQKLMYYPQRLTNTELRAFSK
jgi:hypothetical protein